MSGEILNPEELLRLCRVCMAEKGVVIIFQSRTILRMLNYCFSIQFTEGDGLPESLCVFCLKNLKISYEFQQKCIESDSKLHALFDSIPKKSHVPQMENCKLYDACNDSIGIIKADNIKQELEIEYDCTEEKIKEDCLEHSEEYINVSEPKQDSFNAEVLLSKMKSHGMIIKRWTEENKETTKINNNIMSPVKNVAKQIKKSSNSSVQCERKNSDEQKDALIKEKTNEKCQYCPQTFTDKKLALQHVVFHKNEVEMCKICNKMFKGRYAINKHAGAHDLHPCEHCGKKMKKCYLKKHIAHIHRSFEEECPVCGAILTCPMYFKRHVARHTHKPKYTCDICSKCYSSKPPLRAHILEYHLNKATYYPCSFCTKIFNNIKSKRDHECLHTGFRPYKCPLCDKTFIQRSNMKSHFVNNHKEHKYGEYTKRIKRIKT